MRLKFVLSIILACTISSIGNAENVANDDVQMTQYIPPPTPPVPLYPKFYRCEITIGDKRYLVQLAENAYLSTYSLSRECQVSHSGQVYNGKYVYVGGVF